MKFVCLGYFNPAKMDARPPGEIDAIMSECAGPMKEFRATGRMIVDAGLETEARSLRLVDGAVQVTDGTFTGGAMRVGSVFIIEAQDMDEAVRLASLHPSVRLRAAEMFDWGLDIRAAHHFESHEAAGSSEVPTEA